MNEFLDTIEKINDRVKIKKKSPNDKPTEKKDEENDEEKEVKKRKKNGEQINLKKVINPIFVSVSESAKFGGVTAKTIRRAIQSKKVLYKIENDRYVIEFVSLIKFLTSNKKLGNKLKEFGIGQHIAKWRE